MYGDWSCCEDKDRYDRLVSALVQKSKDEFASEESRKKELLIQLVEDIFDLAYHDNADDVVEDGARDT